MFFSVCFISLHSYRLPNHHVKQQQSQASFSSFSLNRSFWAPPPQAMVETVNNLLQPQAQAAWRELSTGEQLRAATMLLDTVEQGAFVLADNLLKTDIVQENTDNIREYKPRPLSCLSSHAYFIYCR